MQSSRLTRNFKKILILSITANLIAIGMLISIITRGNRGFETSSLSSQTYFNEKYSRQAQTQHRKCYLLIAMAICALVAENIIVVNAFSSHKNSQLPPLKMKNSIYILISIGILFLMPPTIYYLSLVVERYKITRQIYWDEIFISVFGIISSILMTLCCVIVIILQIINERKQDERWLNESKGGFIDEASNILQPESPRIEKKQSTEKESAYAPLLYKELIHKINQNPMNIQEHIFTHNYRRGNVVPSQKITIGKVIKTNDEDDFKPYYEKRQKSELTARAIKISKRKDDEMAQRQMLKSEIEIRKKKFRQLNPYKIEKLKTEQQSDDIKQEQIVYMPKLLKSYRQYIKQAKRPSRRPPSIRLNQQQDQQKQVKSCEEGLDNSPILQKDKQSKSLSIDNGAKIELLCQRRLKAKPRKKRALFEQTGLMMKTQQQQLLDDKIRRQKHAKGKMLTNQQKMILMLKERYNFKEQE